MTNLWQWMLLTNGELDKVTGLIPNRTKGCWWCEAFAAIGDTSIISLTVWKAVEKGLHMCPEYYLLSPFIKALEALHHVNERKSRCFLQIWVWKFHLCEVWKWLGRNELLMWKEKTCVSMPHVTRVSSGKLYQGSSGTEGIISLSSGKVKWVLSSSH